MERGTIRILNVAGFGFIRDASGKDVHFRFDQHQQRRVVRSEDGRRLFFELPESTPIAVNDEVLFIREPGRRGADHARIWGKAPLVISAKEAVSQLRLATALVAVA
jgi:cold shock CspA family protein